MYVNSRALHQNICTENGNQTLSKCKDISDLSGEAGVLVGSLATCLQELCKISHDSLQLLLCSLGLVLHQLSKSPAVGQKARRGGNVDPSAGKSDRKEGEATV